MNVAFKEKGEYLVISVEDKLDSINSKVILDSIAEKLKESDKNVVFDFERLNYISSAGLQILLFAAKNRKSISKEVLIYKPNAMVDNIIKITGFYTFLKKTDRI